MKALTCVSVLVLLVYSSCSKKENPDSSIDLQQLDNAFSQASEMGNLKSLVVAQNGVIIREKYSAASGAQVDHDVRSVTKSITCLLIGIAIDKGYINSIDQTIGDYINSDFYVISTDKARIKIRDLLTMSSGFAWEELVSVNGYNDWITSSDQVQYVLDKFLIYPPGQTFTYNSGALHLLSFILTEATGLKAEDFAGKYLFEPLGIAHKSWQVDKQGFNNGSAGLKLAPADMVKIGELILNRGVYKGQTIVSQSYMDQASQTKITTNNAVYYGSGYGYGLWTGQGDDVNVVFAMGWGGQFIVVVPERGLVVVATNQWSGLTSTAAGEQWSRTIDLIMMEILPAFD